MLRFFFGLKYYFLLKSVLKVTLSKMYKKCIKVKPRSEKNIFLGADSNPGPKFWKS
jgi:hypothetical protein